MNRYARAALLLAVVALVALLSSCSSSDDTVSEVRENLERVRDTVDSQGIFIPAIPIPVDIGEDGRVVKVGGVDAGTIDDLAEEMTGRPLIGRIAFFDQDQIDWYKQANIQHVTVASRPGEGLFVLVNGQALPYLAWDGDSLDVLVDVLGKFQDDGRGAYLLEPDVYDAVAIGLPLLHSLGMRFDIRFPRDPDADEIPLPDDSAFDAALTAAEVEEMPLQNANLDVEFMKLEGSDDWVPSLYGFTTVDFNDAAQPLDWDIPEMRVRRDIRERIEVEGIEEIGFQTRADGVFFQVNGELLPHVAWSEATLSNLTTLLWQLYPPGSSLPEDAEWVPVVRATAPMYNDFDVAARFTFPSEEAE
jgi:hypothetical protein